VRADNILFATDNVDGSKQPRYVVSIDFDGTLQHITSHSDIANVPTALPVLQNAIVGISATSQTLNPDRANATIGSMSFDIVDLASAFTNVVRTQLTTNDIGLRGRTVKFFVGYKSEQDGAGILDGSSTDDNPDFDNFVLFQTQIVQSVETKEGKYSIKCADIQRETKKTIFELELTYLTSSITAAATSIAVLDLSGFEGNVHGTSYTDAPSLDVIYIRLDSTKEIIRCPTADIVGNSFTNVTRGVLGTIAKAVEVDPASASDRRPQVEEYVYLELPAVKLAYAILTGVIEGTANVLPSGWHANVPTSFVRLTDFKTIGDDLWVPTDDTAAVVLRFDGIDKQDAKRFLETEIYLLLGLFSPVYSDGQLGLKRMVPALSDSPFQFDVDDSNVIGSSNLKHDMEAMQNNMRVDWNWNGDRYIRSTIIIDSASIAKHGQAPEKRMSFRGLVGTRFTEQVLRQLLTSLRDMYTGPPLRLDINGFHLMNPLEVGDAVRVNLSNIRDYSQTGTNLVRTMVVHGMTVDWLKGVKLKLFGSSERADEIPPITATTCLPDAFYPQEGTALNSIGGLMTGDVTNAGTFTLVGDADMNAAGAIFYHDGPLTISSTTTLNIELNVQLRVRGFLTIDGSIIGTGEGHISGTDTFVFDEHYYFTAQRNFGVQGFIGNSSTHGGLLIREPDDGGLPSWVWVTGGFSTQGLYDAFPNIILEVDDAGSGAIIGIPTDMRGGGGAFGQRAGLKIGLTGRTHMKNTGGSGGAGGAALCVVCRGGDFGASGVIRLDGADGIEPTGFFTASNPTFHIYGGAGGAGAPGALLWLIDGSAQTFPDLAGHFFAITGDVPAQFALPLGGNRSLVQANAPLKNMAPFFPLFRVSGFDQSGVNFRISFLPCDVVPEDDQAEVVPPPTNLVATEANSGVQLNWTNPDDERLVVDVHRSVRNVRSTAVRIATTEGESWLDNAANVERGVRYYWVQARNADDVVSLFEPDMTTGVAGRPLEDRTNWAVDPEFNIGDPTDNWTGNGNGSQTEFWRANLFPNDGTATADHQPIAGDDGGVAIDLRVFGGSPTSATGDIQSKKFSRFQTNKAVFQFVIKYRTEGSVDALDHTNFMTRIRTATSEFGGGVASMGGPVVTLPRSAAYTVVTLQQKVNSIGTNFIGWAVGFVDSENNTQDALRIDSILVYQVGGDEFGDNTMATVVQAGLVPSALASEAGLFLQGDGTWGTPTGSGVDSFNGRTGAVVPLIADYDSFFLTPAEGDAAYSLLGHGHVPADITFAATDRFLGRDTAGGGAGEELTPAAARTILNVEDGSTADQTAGEIEGIVNHDNLLGFVGDEHINWNVTGAEDIHADRFSSGANMADSLLDRPHISDFAIEHQVVAAIATTVINYSSGQSVLLNMGAVNITTLTLNNWPVTGRLGQYEIEIAQGSTPRTIAWPAAVDWVTGVEPDLTTANETYLIHLSTRNAGTNIIGSYAADSSTGVTSVFGRSGAVVALLADYDSFFLTPAEGDAAYSLLGHGHVPADITFAATDRLLGRDTAGGGAGEELTAAAVRAILNVEDGSTADQTSIVGITGTGAQFDTAVTDENFAFAGGAFHDGFSDFVAAEHIDWSASGAENLQVDRFAIANFTGLVNMQDNILRRALMEDFAVDHQVVTGVASTTINYVSGQSVLLNLSAADITTLTITNWPATSRLGQLEIEVTQGSTPRTIAWDTAISGTVEWPGGTEPDLNVANGKFLIQLRSRDNKTTLTGSYVEDLS